jgi:hypothetical protein
MMQSVESTPLPGPFAIRVDCYAGHRGEETPRRFWLSGVAIDIAEVVDRWLAPDHRYFKVQDSRGDRFILREDVTSQRWELTFFQRRADVDPTAPQRE